MYVDFALSGSRTPWNSLNSKKALYLTEIPMTFLEFAYNFVVTVRRYIHHFGKYLINFYSKENTIKII